MKIGDVMSQRSRIPHIYLHLQLKQKGWILLPCTLVHPPFVFVSRFQDHFCFVVLQLLDIYLRVNFQVDSIENCVSIWAVPAVINKKIILSYNRINGFLVHLSFYIILSCQSNCLTCQCCNINAMGHHNMQWRCDHDWRTPCRCSSCSSYCV